MTPPIIEPTPFWQTLDFWNFIIAVLALLAAFYSIWYTRQRDKTTLEIFKTWYKIPEGNPFLISFTLFNNSSTAVKVTNIELLNLDNTPASVIENYSYKSPYQNDFWAPASVNIAPNYEPKPFNKEEIIAPNTAISFRYYLNPLAFDMKIKITADRPIHRWSKTKTFLVHFVQSN